MSERHLEDDVVDSIECENGHLRARYLQDEECEECDPEPAGTVGDHNAKVDAVFRASMWASEIAGREDLGLAHARARVWGVWDALEEEWSWIVTVVSPGGLVAGGRSPHWRTALEIARAHVDELRTMWARS